MIWLYLLISYQWAVASLFILCVGMSMAELGSAAPTSGGVSLSGLRDMVVVTDVDDHSYTSGHTLCHLPGVGIFSPGSLGVSSSRRFDEQSFNDSTTDSNTIGSIASVGKRLYRL